MKRVLTHGQCAAGALIRASYRRTTHTPNVRTISKTTSQTSPSTAPNEQHENSSTEDAKNNILDSTWYAPDSEQGNADALRSAMRTFAHSVVVVTTSCESSSPMSLESIDPKQDNVELLSPYYRNFCGAAISSLQTVTLGPPAMISFNLKIPSRTLSGLLHHKQFGVHLLRNKSEGQLIADTFIQQSHSEAFRALTRRGLWVGFGLSPRQSKTENPENGVVPIIRGNGVYSFMRCEVIPDKCVVVGDHMVVIAKVASVGLPRRSFAKEGALAYQHGSYARLNKIELSTKHNVPDQKTADKKTATDIWQIKKNRFGVHNDTIGQTGFTRYQPTDPDVRYASVNETGPKKATFPAIRPDPLGSTGEKEDGKFTGLGEEGYQKLAKQIEQQRQQGEIKESPK